jgi:hypothetical protein
MKIGIVGSGWVGCHLAHDLSKDHDVVLFSKTGKVFNDTSLFNQNRLHLGYHYARSNKTRLLCKKTFNTFIEKYSTLTDVVKNNIYAIPHESNIDFETYLKIFDDFNHELYDAKDIKNIAGAIRVKERYINPSKSKSFFQEKLQHIIVTKTIDEEELVNISKEYDLIINCTNNFLKPDKNNTFWENCVMLVYNKKANTDFGALTLVDGPFFSIYPYLENSFTLSHVTHTPVRKYNSPPTEEQLIVDNIEDLKAKIETEVIKYFPDFHNRFSYSEYTKSVKIKRNIRCDDRSPVMYMEDNIVNCYTGKIQGIFYLEEYIKSII